MWQHCSSHPVGKLYPYVAQHVSFNHRCKLIKLGDESCLKLGSEGAVGPFLLDPVLVDEWLCSDTTESTVVSSDLSPWVFGQFCPPTEQTQGYISIAGTRIQAHIVSSMLTWKRHRGSWFAASVTNIDWYDLGTAFKNSGDLAYTCTSGSLPVAPHLDSLGHVSA